MLRPTKYPSIGDTTMVVPYKITDIGVYVKLLEYGDIEGIITLSDLHKSKFKSVNKIISIGKKFPASVLVSEPEKNNIMLSKKEVSTDEAIQYEQTYKTLKLISDIVTSVVRKAEKNILVVDRATIYNTFIWSISHDPNEVIAVLKKLKKNLPELYKNNLPETELLQYMQDVLNTKFRDLEVTVEAVLNIKCYSIGGVNIIKGLLCDSLIKLQKKSTNFKIKIVKPPYYSIICKTTTPNEIIDNMKEIITEIETELKRYDGSLQIEKMPETIMDKEFEPELSDDSD